MKYSIKTIFILTTALFIQLLAVRSYAQCFVPATVPELTTSPGSFTYVNNSGNDIKKSQGGFGIMHAYVFDGNKPCLGWDDGAGNIGVITLNATDAIDPDVTLIEDAGTWWAIVPYYSTSAGGFVCDFYVWGFPSFSYVSTSLLSGSTSFGSTINIDGLSSGSFVIVWDDPSTGNIQVIGGSTTGAGPALCNGGVPSALPGTTGNRSPDVSLYVQVAGCPACDYIHYVYLNNAGTKIYMTYDKVGYLCAGTPNNIPDFGASTTTGFFAYPRISTPNQNYGSILDWAVAVVKVNNFTGAYDIAGFTDLTGTHYTWNYTNGLTWPILCNISLPGNKEACVSYDSGGNGIMVGWKSFYPFDPFLVPPACVAIECNNKGAFTGCGYMNVPSTNGGSTNTQAVLSISGRDYPGMFYTFFDANTKDVLYKDVPFFSCPLREMNATDAVQASVYPNPFSSNLTLDVSSEDALLHLIVSDITGRILVNTSGNSTELNACLKASVPEMEDGVYVIRLTNGKNEMILNDKLVKH